jgi:hypothetical protein
MSKNGFGFVRRPDRGGRRSCGCGTRRWVPPAARNGVAEAQREAATADRQLKGGRVAGQAK